MNNYIDAKKAVSRNEFIKCGCHSVLYCKTILEQLDLVEEIMINTYTKTINVSASDITDTCSICLESTNTVTECGHHFHQECIDEIEDSRCPMCRRHIKYITF